MSQTVNIDLKIRLIDIPNELGKDRYYYALKLSDYGSELDLLKTNNNKLSIPDIVMTEDELKHNQCICVVGHSFTRLEQTDVEIGSIDANINTPQCFKSIKMSLYKVVTIDSEYYVLLMITVDYCQWNGNNTTVYDKEWKTISTPVTGIIQSISSNSFLKDGVFYTNLPDTKITTETMVEPLSVTVVIDKDKMDYNIVNPAYAVNDRMANAEDLFVEFFVNQGTQNPIHEQDYYLYAPNKDYCPSRKEIESNKFKIAYQTKYQFDVYNNHMDEDELLDWFKSLPEKDLTDGLLICLYRIFSPKYYNDFYENIKSSIDKFVQIKGMSINWTDDTPVYDFIVEYSNHTSYINFENITAKAGYQTVFSNLFSSITNYILENTLEYALDTTNNHYFCENFGDCNDNVPYIYLKDLSSDNIQDCMFHNDNHLYNNKKNSYYEPCFQYDGHYADETNGTTTNQYFDPYIIAYNLYGEYKYYFKRCDYTGVSNNPNNVQTFDFTMGQLIQLHYMVIQSVFQYLVLESSSVTLTNLKVNLQGSNYIDRIKHEYTESSLVRLCDIMKQYLLVNQYTYEPIVSYLGMNSLRETEASDTDTEPTYEEPSYKQTDFTLKNTYTINQGGQSDSITASVLKPCTGTYNARGYTDEDCTNLLCCLYDSKWLSSYKNTLPYNPIGQTSSMMPIFSVSSYNSDEEEVVYAFQYNANVPSGTVYSYEIWLKEKGDNDIYFARANENSHLLFVRPPLNNTPYVKSINMQDCLYQPTEGSTASLPTITQYPKMYIVYVLLYQNSIEKNGTSYIPTGKTVYFESLESEDCHLQKVDEKFLKKQFACCQIPEECQRNFNGDNRQAYIITNLKDTYTEINKLHFKVNYKYAPDDNSIYALNNDICIHLSIHGPYTDVYASTGLISMLNTEHTHVSHWDFGGNGFGTAYNPFCYPYHNDTYGKFSYINISDNLNQTFALGMIKQAKTSTQYTSVTHYKCKALLQDTALAEQIAQSYGFDGAEYKYDTDVLYGNSTSDEWYVLNQITYINDFYLLFSNYDSNNEGDTEKVQTIYIKPSATPISDVTNDNEEILEDYYKVVILDNNTLDGKNYKIDFDTIDNEQTEDGDVHLILFYEYADEERNIVYINPKYDTFDYKNLKHNWYIHFMMVKGGTIRPTNRFNSTDIANGARLLRMWFSIAGYETQTEIMAGDKIKESLLPSEETCYETFDDNSIDYDYYYNQAKNK